MVERRTLKLLAALSMSLFAAVNSATAGPEANNANSRTDTGSFTSSKHTRLGVCMQLHGDPGTIEYKNAVPRRKYTGLPQEESDDGSPEPFQSYVQVYHTGAFNDSRPSQVGTHAPPNPPTPGSPINLPQDILPTESSLPTAACELPKFNLQCSVGTLKFFIPISPLELLETEAQLVKFVNSIWRANDCAPTASHMGH